MTGHEVLVRARNLIEREGWIQDLCIEPEGVCTFGACGIAAGYYNRAGDTVGDGVEGVVLNAALDALEACLPAGVRPIDFNEDAGRTKDEVLALFDEGIAATAPAPDFASLEVPEEVVA